MMRDPTTNTYDGFSEKFDFLNSLTHVGQTLVYETYLYEQQYSEEGMMKYDCSLSSEDILKLFRLAHDLDITFINKVINNYCKDSTTFKLYANETIDSRECIGNTFKNVFRNFLHDRDTYFPKKK